MPPTKKNPEEEARELVDTDLVRAGWIQDRDGINLQARRGVAMCEFKGNSGHGFADYLLLVDGKAVGALEAKPASHPLLGDGLG